MEGVIKFNAKQISSNSISNNEFEKIAPWRDKCVHKSYIGVADDGIGYGNISFRSGNNNEFIISASATGNIKISKAEDYSKIMAFDIKNNTLECIGGKLASSESLSHAAIYNCNPEIKTVLHIHNIDLWNKYKNILPTTSKQIEYGTQDMANAIAKLTLSIGKNQGIIVMGGHIEGLLSFGETLEGCIKALDNL